MEAGPAGLFGNLSDELESSDDEPVAVGALDYLTDSGKPAYLIAAVLAGLYELPPIALLRNQNGLGRRVRYSSFLMQPLDWQPLHSSRFASFSRAVLSSRCPHSGIRRGIGLYSLAVPDPSQLNSALFRLAKAAALADCDGVEVSNAAGGWHSQPRLFSLMEGAVQELKSWLSDAAALAEADCSLLSGCPKRELADNGHVESWWNLSQVPGAWNRLHTHQGSCWSLVYYVAPGKFDGGGQLLLKPSPHYNDSTLPELTAVELARLLPSEETEPGPEVGEYILIEPEAGSIVVFPSWLQHAVLPLEGTAPIDANDARLSVACNFDFKQDKQ